MALNQPWTGTVRATGNFAIGDITVTMGGVDITSNLDITAPTGSRAELDRTISIPSVSGDVVITVNVVPLENT